MNGDFDTDLQFWDLEPDNGAIIHSSLDAEGSSSSGSLQVLGSAEVIYSMGQCVTIGGNEFVELSAAMRLDSTELVFLERVCTFHAAANCQDPISQQSQIEPFFDTAGAFELRELQLQTPPRTSSVDCHFLIQSDAPLYDFYLDQVFLEREETVFRDDFEAGDTGDWSLVVP